MSKKDLGSPFNSNTCQTTFPFENHRTAVLNRRPCDQNHVLTEFFIQTSVESTHIINNFSQCQALHAKIEKGFRTKDKPVDHAVQVLWGASYPETFLENLTFIQALMFYRYKLHTGP